MSLPTERTVTGKYVNPVTGEPYDGTGGDHYVIFEPVPDRWKDQANNQILLGGGRVNLGADGTFAESLVCTDSPFVLPMENRLWRIRQFIGGAWTVQLVVVPVGSGPLDVTDYLSVEVDGVSYVPVPGPPGPAGPNGGEPGKSAYEVAVENGYSGTQTQWLASLVGAPGTDGADGDSAYQVALDDGFVGTRSQWLASLVGPQGSPGAQGVQGQPGATGPQGATGPAGESAYQAALDGGFSGTEADWLASLVGPQGTQGAQGIPGGTGPQGESAYELAVDDGFSGTMEEWLVSLTGPQGAPGKDGGLDTGVLYGGSLTPNGSNPMAVDIGPLLGQIVDYSTNPVTVTAVSLTAPLTVELDDVAQDRTATWLLMDAAHNVFQQEARPSPEDRRNLLVLGLVAQSAGTIFLTQAIPTAVQQPANQLADFLDALGPFVMSGNDVTPNGTGLTLDHAPGQVFSRGWNYLVGGTQTNNPHVISTVGATPADWIHLLRTGDLDVASATATVDVGHYDSGGVLTEVGGTEDTSVVHRLWIFPTIDSGEIHVLQYGQQLFDNLDDAIAGATGGAYATNPLLPGNAVLLGFLAVNAGAGDLSASTQAVFIKASKFGGSAGGGGGGTVDLSAYALLAGAEFTGIMSSLLPSDDALAQTSRTSVNTFDMFRRLASGEMQWGSGSGPMDSRMVRLGAGLLALLGTDLLIGQEDAKAYRFRQSGGALDLEGSGADLFFSVYELVNFAGTQQHYLRLESGVQLAHAIGKWVFSASADGAAVHTLDGLADELGFHGADPVGQQTVTGARSTGGALQSILAALETVGLITDSSTAGPDVVETVNGEAGPDVTLSAADVEAVPAAEKGVADGVATLGGDGKVPAAQLPAQAVTSVNGESGAVDLSAGDVGAIPATQKGAANGVASLGSDGKVPGTQLPAAPVTSVNGEIGAVSLDAADVGALTQVTADGRYVRQDALTFNVKEHGAVGNGTADDATAIQSLLDSSPAGSTVFLPPGTYATSVPLVVPPGKTLRGARANFMTVDGLYDPQVCIKPKATFTGVAAILLKNQADGGYATVSGEQRLADLMLDGANLSTGVDGLQAKGNIQSVGLDSVTIRNFPNSGIYLGLGGDDIAPYSWRLDRVILDRNHAHGLYGDRPVDMTLIDVLSIGNWSNGIMLANAANSQLTSCRAEWNGNHGYYFTGDWGQGAGSGGALMSGCSTDRNGFNGIFIDVVNTNAPLVISGLMTRRDGRNGGTGGGGYAGLAGLNTSMPLIIGDWTNFPGVDDGGASTSSPQYGASFNNCDHVQIDNAYLHAATGGLHDAGGNDTLRLGANITYATGPTSAPVRTLAKSSEIVIAASNSRSAKNADYICDGVADNVEIQAAINLVNAAPGKGTVRLLDGTYNLAATLSIPNGTGLALVGSGWGTVLKNNNATNQYAITFAGPGETRARFADFTLDGNLTNQTTGGGGIWAPGAVQSVFHRLHVTACYTTGLYLGPQADNAFGHNNHVSQCLFDNAMNSPGAGRALHLTSNDENFIVACDFEFLGGVTGPAAGIYDQAGTQTILGCNFVGGGHSMPAVRVQDCSATKILGCNFDGIGGDGVFLAATNCTVQGNTIFGVGEIGTAGAYSGIHLEYAATGNLISGNSLASSTTNGAARSLIREESVGGSGGNSVVGNALITKGTLSVAALDLNAPGTLARANLGGGAAGDPVVLTASVGAASGVASLDSGSKVPIGQIPNLPASQINSGAFATARIPDLSATYLTTTQRGAASGVASLDASSLVPVAQIPSLPASQIGSGTLASGRIPDLSATYVAVTQKAAASGVASLDATTKVPVAQIPDLPASQIASGTLNSSRLPDLSTTYLAVGQRGAASGVASLDASTKVPSAQLPDLSATYIAVGQKGAASGVATLDSGSKVPGAQIPDLSGSYAALSTYGNVWQASDHGLIARSMDPEGCDDGGTVLATGRIYLIGLVLRTAATLTKTNLVVGTAGSTLTASQCFVGLYDSSGNRVAVSADQSTVWNSAGDKSSNFAASYSAAAGRYYVALLVNGTTSPNFACGTTYGANFTPGNAGLSSGSYRFCRSASTGNTSLPSSITLSTYTPDANNVYVGVG